MDLSNLRPAKGSTHNSKRIGRGEGSGKGGTATRGHKGAQSRSGYHRKWGFEGGQMPLQRRVPKYGFKNPFRISYTAINLELLQRLADQKQLSEISPEILYQHGLCSKQDKVKILGKGSLNTTMNVKAHAFSESATKAIEEAGGKTETV